jgi:hypothetical protein
MVDVLTTKRKLARIHKQLTLEPELGLDEVNLRRQVDGHVVGRIDNRALGVTTVLAPRHAHSYCDTLFVSAHGTVTVFALDVTVLGPTFLQL